MAREQIQEGALVRLKSGTEGWIKGQVVEYFDVIPTAGPGGKGYMYGGGMTPGYKVHILEGKHKGETIRVPENYVEPIGQAKPGGEPLYPHVPKSRQPLFPHVPGGRQPGTKLPATEKLSRNDVEVYLSLPPYKASIWVENKKTGKTIWKLEGAENINRFGWKDQNRDQLEESVLKHLEDIGVLSGGMTGSSLELLASTEGDPIRKFCCRQCGECAPKELLEEGRFLDRISWLRDHYKEKHPGTWGKRLPLTVIEGFEPVSPQYRHLVGLVSEPLPKEAD